MSVFWKDEETFCSVIYVTGSKCDICETEKGVFRLWSSESTLQGTTSVNETDD